MSDGYLSPTTLEHCFQYTNEVDLRVLPKANVVAVFEGGDWLLAEVTPPNEECNVYIYSFGDVVKCDVRDLFKEVQSSLCWAEI